VPLDNAAVKGINKGSKAVDVITAIENVEKDYMEKTGKPESSPSWDSFDSFEPVKKGIIWNKLLLYQSEKEPYKTAVVYYTVTSGELVYFYINTDQTDKEIRKAEKGIEEILEMTLKEAKEKE